MQSPTNLHLGSTPILDYARPIKLLDMLSKLFSPNTFKDITGSQFTGKSKTFTRLSKGHRFKYCEEDFRKCLDKFSTLWINGIQPSNEPESSLYSGLLASL